MCYLHLFCRQWSYLRQWLSRKAGTGAAPATGGQCSVVPATAAHCTAGDNCCSQLKIVSTPPHQQPRHHPHCHAGTCHVSRGSTCVAAGMQTLTAGAGGVETLTPVSGLRDTATPTEGAEPAATPEPELGREEERWQRNFAKVSQYSEKTLVSVASAYMPFHIYESI